MEGDATQRVFAHYFARNPSYKPQASGTTDLSPRSSWINPIIQKINRSGTPKLQLVIFITRTSILQACLCDKFHTVRSTLTP